MGPICWMMAAAWAGGSVDYADEAERRMKLSFDLDEIEGELARPARSPAPMAEAPYQDAWDVTPYVEPARPRLPLEPNSTLDTVTVHPDRALVTRVRELDVPKGPTALAFEGLPLGIVPDGLAARVTAGDARIVSVELRSGAGEVEDSERIERIREDAAAVVQDLGEVRDRIEALLAQRAWLRSALVPESATSAPSLAQVGATLDTIGQRERQIAKDLREEEERAKELGEKLEPMLTKLEDPMATGREVRLEIEAGKPGKVAVELRYAVVGAGWSPSYRARLDPVSGKVELEIYGVVSQSTGEDWTEAAVWLSTADPVGRGTVQDLVPWTLGRSGGVGVFGALDQGSGATGPALPPPAGGGVVDSRLAARVEGSGAVVLGIEGRRTIRGDGSAQRLPVAVQTLDGAVSLASIPKLAPEVVRQVAVRYDGTVPLLPGPVSAFVGADYVGSGAIRPVVSGEPLKLAFGTDDRVRVSRQLVSRTSERAGRKATRYTFRFRTTVANHGDRDVAVELADQVPRSEDARLEVRVLDTGGGAQHDDGRVSWSVPLKPGGEATVELAFSVTVPDDLAWVGQEMELLF